MIEGNSHSQSIRLCRVYICIEEKIMLGTLILIYVWLDNHYKV